MSLASAGQHISLFVNKTCQFAINWLLLLEEVFLKVKICCDQYKDVMTFRQAKCVFPIGR